MYYSAYDEWHKVMRIHENERMQQRLVNPVVRGSSMCSRERVAINAHQTVNITVKVVQQQCEASTHNTHLVIRVGTGWDYQLGTTPTHDCTHLLH